VHPQLQFVPGFDETAPPHAIGPGGLRPGKVTDRLDAGAGEVLDGMFDRFDVVARDRWDLGNHAVHHYRRPLLGHLADGGVRHP